MNKRPTGKESRLRSMPAVPIDEGRELHRRIAEKAYEIYRNRGGTDGSDVDDWLEAERLIRSNSSPIRSNSSPME